jgi:hypothetical protein
MHSDELLLRCRRKVGSNKEKAKEQQSEVKATESTEKPNACESDKANEQQSEKKA